jgi:LysM domain
MDGMSVRTRGAVVLVAAIVVGCIPSTGGTGASAPGTVSAPSVGPSEVPPASGPSSRPSFVRPTPTPLPTFLVYTVRPGDTLTSIARAFRTTARSIAFWNRTNHPSLDPDSPQYEPDRIEVGWELFLVPDVELDPEDLPEPETSSPPPSPSAGSG